jgi:hypothetical protein
LKVFFEQLGFTMSWIFAGAASPVRAVHGSRHWRADDQMKRASVLKRNNLAQPVQVPWGLTVLGKEKRFDQAPRRGRSRSPSTLSLSGQIPFARF